MRGFAGKSWWGVPVGVGLLGVVVAAGVNLLTVPVDGDWVRRWWVWIATGVLLALVAGVVLQRGRVAGSPVVRTVAAVDAGDGVMEVVVATASGAVLSSGVRDGGGWEKWVEHPMSGRAWDVAAVQPSRDVVEYYVVDRDGGIRGRRRDRGEWSSWRNVPAPESGHARVVRISAASLKPGHRELYAVLDDGRLLHAWKWDDSSIWSEWYATEIAGGTDVAACSPKDDLLELFFLDRDGNVWHRWYWNATWHEWENWGYPGSSARAVTVFCRAVDHQEIFVAGKAGDLANRWHKGGEAWSDWGVLETPDDFVDVAGATTSAFRLWCIGVGSDGRLWSRTNNRGWAPQWRRVNIHQ